MKHYEIIKANAEWLAQQRKQNVYITKANKKNDYVLIFEGQQPTRNYHIIETVKYEPQAAERQPDNQ